MVAARVGGRTADGQRRPAVVIRLAGAKSSATSSLGTLRSFSEADFQVRLTQVYGRVREAWTAQRLADLEPDVTIDLLAAWTARLAAAPVPVMVPVQRVTSTLAKCAAVRRCSCGRLNGAVPVRPEVTPARVAAPLWCWTSVATVRAAGPPWTSAG